MRKLLALATIALLMSAPASAQWVKGFAPADHTMPGPTSYSVKAQ